jgi:hypothetical protein
MASVISAPGGLGFHPDLRLDKAGQLRGLRGLKDWDRVRYSPSQASIDQLNDYLTTNNYSLQGGEGRSVVGYQTLRSDGQQVGGGPTMSLFKRQAGGDYSVAVYGPASAPAGAPADEPPAAPFRPSPELVAARDRARAWQSRGGLIPRSGPDLSATGGQLFQEIWDQGTRQKRGYERRFIPALVQNANLAALEIGEGGRYQLGRFRGQVPSLADPREAFEYYLGKVDPKASTT